MEIVGQRLKLLRDGIKLSQKKIAALIGTQQTSINRYETDQYSPPLKVLLWYADYFDVSLDYIFGRTDNPQGKLYNYEPEVLKIKAENQADMEEFVEMCFNPDSPMSAKLKETMLKMMGVDKE